MGPFRLRLEIEQAEGFRVGCAAVIFLQCGGEDARLRRYSCEQRHAGAEFEVVGKGKMALAEAGPRQARARAFQQPRAKHRVSEIGARLVRRGDPVFLRHRTAAQSTQLRKNVPHPVAALLALPQLGHGPGVGAFLRVHESLKVERVRLLLVVFGLFGVAHPIQFPGKIDPDTLRHEARGISSLVWRGGYISPGESY